MIFFNLTSKLLPKKKPKEHHLHKGETQGEDYREPKSVM